MLAQNACLLTDEQVQTIHEGSLTILEKAYAEDGVPADHRRPTTMAAMVKCGETRYPGSGDAASTGHIVPQ